MMKIKKARKVKSEVVVVVVVVVVVLGSKMGFNVNGFSSKSIMRPKKQTKSET
jgi:hypothetical protein